LDRDPYEDFETLTGYAAFEVYNGSCEDVHRADSTDYWDRSLTTRPRALWAVAADDMHKPQHDFATGWTWVNGERNRASVLSAIERGDFYATTGPRIERIRTDESSITLLTSRAQLV
jgi:hypothetical protein